ncbi:MAG: hypothetical protein COC21_04825 [Verrucomicrobiales bacterium]|nr:MAG: hypothetical protein COC21_04825 [Verrucomicrobiales bacterium]
MSVDTRAFSIRAPHALADVPSPDVFVIPGGMAGTFAAAGDEEILSWVRAAHAHSRFSTSVCTGSLILGAAGLLKGVDATTHWAARALLESNGAIYTEERVVRPLLSQFDDGSALRSREFQDGFEMACRAEMRASLGLAGLTLLKAYCTVNETDVEQLAAYRHQVQVAGAAEQVDADAALAVLPEPTTVDAFLGGRLAAVQPADGRHQFVYPRFGHLLARAPGQV